MRPPSFVAALVMGAVLAGNAFAAAQDTRPASLDDVLAFKAVASPTISPDGRWVAFVVTVRDMDENRYDADVWLVTTDGGDPIQLTRSPGFDGAPAWSPDGTWLAFRSDRAGKSQVYGIAPTGGEAWAVTDHETDVQEFAVSPDGRRIAFVAAVSASDEDEALEDVRGRPLVADSAYATDWARLWVAPLENRVAGEATLSSPDGHHVSDPVWSPDSRSVAWASRPSPLLRAYVDGSVFIQDEPGAEPRQVTTMPGGENPVDWTAELGLLVAGTGQRLGTYNNRVWRVSPEGAAEPVSLTDALDEHARLVWAGREALLIEASHRTSRRLIRIPVDPADGGPQVVYQGELFTTGFDASKDGRRVSFIAESTTRPPDVHVADVSGSVPRTLTHLNPHAEGITLGETRVVTWSSRADGEEIEGVLTLPVGYREGQRVPLLLRIHGGPSGVSTMSYHADDGTYPTQVFAGLGYAVLQPNYRGSTGYGERFRGLNRGDISGRDWVDVDSGVDHLIELGIADPDRLGVMGWSFGGHHTYWGITQTDRYKAASAGAGANALVSMFHQTDLPGFYHTYLGPSPWEDWDLYEERSAYRRVDRVTTPLLIQVGENDERVPKEQSRMFYEAVRDIGKAPVKMVTYPGQPHGIREPVLQRDLMTRNVEWFSRWIPVDRGAADGS